MLKLSESYIVSDLTSYKLNCFLYLDLVLNLDYTLSVDGDRE